jgi:hypothetical protein
MLFAGCLEAVLAFIGSAAIVIQIDEKFGWLEHVNRGNRFNILNFLP